MKLYQIKYLAMKDESFRDHIGTINEDGTRHFIFPKKPHGKFYNARTYLSWVLLAFFFVGPFIKINGNPLILINVLERKFSLLGSMFYPQDFYIFVLMMIAVIVFVVLFTVVFGRIFCGWLCPQTIFLEMVFRKIEYVIDGDRVQQMKLAKMPWNAEKYRKRIVKWIVYLIISFVIANTFLAYITGIDKLYIFIQEGPIKNPSGYGALILFTGAFFFIFASFREQACLIACPYGRLQGVLLDRKSIQVSYDYVRGEKEKGRAKFKKSEDRTSSGKGDCIDCNQCVEVCPTGIDIRNGSQLECVNCTACMDACNSVMDSVGLPTGLIRYASEDNIANGEKPSFNARIIGYTTVLTILLIVVASLLMLRSDVDTNILRLPGQLYQTEQNGDISNVFTYKMVNKTNYDKAIELKLISHEGEIEMVGRSAIVVKARERYEGTIFVKIPKDKLNRTKNKVVIGVYEGGKLIKKVKTNFIGPIKF
jgi:cytochrome c oxidase accessory protein FixG